MGEGIVNYELSIEEMALGPEVARLRYETAWKRGAAPRGLRRCGFTSIEGEKLVAAFSGGGTCTAAEGGAQADAGCRWEAGPVLLMGGSVHRLSHREALEVGGCARMKGRGGIAAWLSNKLADGGVDRRGWARSWLGCCGLEMGGRAVHREVCWEVGWGGGAGFRQQEGEGVAVVFHAEEEEFVGR